ncbi:MAG: signal peptide peptidase SppA, partial [Sediminispirochaetaceae bacterium]
TVLIDCAQDLHAMLAGGAEAIREQLDRLTASGRKTIFYAAEYSPLQLYLASACTRRMIHPLGTLSFLGLSRSFLFFKPAADKLRIESTVLRRGRYKSAGDRFRTDRMDPFNREQYEQYLHGAVREMGEKITAGMEKTQTDLEELTAGRMLSAEEALEEGWIHEIRTSDQLRREWKRRKHRNRSVKKVGRSYGRGRKKIAVLVFEGAVIDGKSKRHPLLGQAVGAESFVPHVHKLADDSSVKGVVLRGNSGGGSAAASEDIRNALEELREKKSLVVSMSEAAASGGYWISCGAERIFAHADTLTGSIGVITLHLALQNFLKRHGINAESLRTGPHADLGSALRQITEEEKKILDVTVERLYRSFIRRVADARNQDPRRVEKIAGGRVWSGSDALQKGLVDEVGGLVQAVDYLKGQLGLPKPKVVFYPRVRRSLIERLLERSSADEACAGGMDMAVVMPADYLMRLLRDSRGLTAPLALLPEGSLLTGGITW